MCSGMFCSLKAIYCQTVGHERCRCPLEDAGCSDIDEWVILSVGSLLHKWLVIRPYALIFAMPVRRWAPTAFVPYGF